MRALLESVRTVTNLNNKPIYRLRVLVEYLSVVNAKADWLKRDVAERVRTNCKDALAGELRDLMSDISADHHTSNTVRPC